MKPRILDLFCGAGGAAKGYSDAGFEVVGVDIRPQPNFPFEFVQADALQFVGSLAWNYTGPFDAIHASPPCQGYSRALKHLAAEKPMLIDGVRLLLEATGLPWVVENVVGAPLPSQDTLDGRFGVELCGTMFGKSYYRHRLFETSFPAPAPRGCGHLRPAMNPHNQRGRDRIYAEMGRQDPERPWREEMGVDWMNKHEARESIPPVFTEHIGSHLMAEVRRKVAA